MIKVLEQAIEQIRKLPAERQEYAASVLDEIAADATSIYALSDDERALVCEGVADLDAGRIVGVEDMKRFWSRHRT